MLYLITLSSEHDMKRAKGRKTIYFFISFERFGLAEQHWSLMLSLTFQPPQVPRNILEVEMTARLEGKLPSYRVENVQSCDRGCIQTMCNGCFTKHV